MFKILAAEKLKILLTAAVASFFLFFWINGPLGYLEETIVLDSLYSRFGNARLVSNEQTERENIGIIGDADEKGYGHGLLIDREKNRDNSNLITAREDESRKLRNCESILEHARNAIDGSSYEVLSSENFCYVSIKGEEEYIYAESRDLLSNVRGYAGPVNVGMIFNSRGGVEKVRHISSRETESYLQKITRSGFYDQFHNLSLSGKKEIDAVSGATLTTVAIAQTVTQLTDALSPEPLHDFGSMNELSAFSVEAKLSWWWILHLVVIFLFFAYGIQKKWKRRKNAQLIIAVLSVLYIGFFLNNSFTYVSFIHPFIGTSVSSMVGIYALFTLLGAIWGKNTYCKYVCPFGNAQRLVLRFTPKKTRRKFFLSDKWTRRFRDGLTLVLITGVLLGLRNWSNFELYPDLFGMDINAWFFSGALALVLLSMRYPMIWCRLLCPTGSVLDALSAIADFKRKSRHQDKVSVS